MLYRAKGDFQLFRLHTPAAIFALSMVFLHLASAVMDNFKWGKSITLLQYMGFSWSDQWLSYLSIGTLAFYLLVVVSVTSSSKAISKLRFKNWKLVHYFSYIAFVMAYIHSMNLGTDLRHGALQAVLAPIFIICFTVATGLLASRVISGAIRSLDQAEVALLSALILLLITGLALILYGVAAHGQPIAALEADVSAGSGRLNYMQIYIDKLERGYQALQKYEVNPGG